MDERGTSMTDAGPLVKIKKSLTKLKSEIRDMDLRIGVVSLLRGQDWTAAGRRRLENTPGPIRLMPYLHFSTRPRRYNISCSPPRKSTAARWSKICTPIPTWRIPLHSPTGKPFLYNSGSATYKRPRHTSAARKGVPQPGSVVTATHHFRPFFHTISLFVNLDTSLHNAKHQNSIM